jgi:hypothetical protein
MENFGAFPRITHLALKWKQWRIWWRTPGDNTAGERHSQRSRMNLDALDEFVSLATLRFQGLQFFGILVGAFQGEADGEWPASHRTTSLNIRAWMKALIRVGGMFKCLGLDPQFRSMNA